MFPHMNQSQVFSSYLASNKGVACCTLKAEELFQWNIHEASFTLHFLVNPPLDSQVDRSNILSGFHVD